MFKIADAYVEIHSRINRSDFLKDVGRFLQFGPLIGALALSIGNVAASLLGFVSSLSLASLSIAAIIPLGLALGGVFGVLALLFGDMEKGVMKDFHDRMVQIKEDFAEMAQQAVAPGLRDFMSTLDQIVPLARANLRRIALAIGDVGHALADLARSPVFQAKLSDLFHQASFGAAQLLSVVDDVVDMLVTLGAAAGPIFQRFVNWLTTLVHRWHEWLTYKDSTGELMALLNRAGEQAATWAGIVSNFFVGFVGMLAAASGRGAELSANLLRISEAFKTWAWDPETHGKIKELLEFFQRIDFARIWELVSILFAMGTALRLMQGASGAVAALLQLLMLGPVGLILIGVAFALTMLVGVLMVAWYHSDTFRSVLSQIYVVVKAELLPKLQELWDWLENRLMVTLKDAVERVLPALKDAWDEIKSTWEDNKEEIKDLTDKLMYLTEIMISVVIPVAVNMAATFIGIVADAFRVAATAANILNDALSAVGRVVGWAKDVVVGAFGEMRGAIGNTEVWFREKIDSIARIIQGLPGRVTGILGSVASQLGPVSWILGLGRAHGGIIGAAAGGPRSGLTMVGEAGPELVHLPAGSRVRSNPDTRRMMNDGPQQSTAPPQVTFAGNTSDALATVIMGLFRTGKIQITGNFG